MKRSSFAALTWAGAVLLSAGAFAQGSDNCTTPTPLSGPGNYAFNNTAATTGTQGQNNAICNQFGTPGIARDVWFAWTATSTGQFAFSTCGLTGIDSKLAVYAGSGCPAGAALGCSDDACALQSSVSIAVTSGNVYSVQLGVFPGSAGGSGTLSIQTSTPCSGSAGPDVIVGDLLDIQNEAPNGALDALTLGTVSCNIGTVNLNWFASSNQHPVIGGNLYRYSVVNGAGRFEQIGQSWLKHGFFALSEQLCCSGCQSTTGSTLGVNCSDPYTASLNAQQGGLGPRYQVNAHTGAFTYPPANPAWSGSTARRCEFLLTDVTTGAGQRYFGEGQYVTPDDAAAGNQNNNASYRELTAGGSAANRSFSLLGPTQREKAAIEAWKAVDPTVTLNDVQVPGDGQYTVAYRTTNIGGGQTHYEYAIHNLNGDRCGGTFSIPIPAGVTVTNIGFHDVAYRNSDGSGVANFSGLDWTANLAGGALTWSTEPQAINPLGNALRWGTTYNFRFDANTGPASGTATLGLWKIGSPASVTTTVEVPSGGSTSFGYCFGDGSGTSCPCGNNSSPFANAGCLNSLDTAGQLIATGTASISNDTVVLSTAGMPDSSALYFQGTTQVAGGAGAVFGDGLRCAGGTVVRLATKTNVGGSSQFPAAGDPPLHVKGGTVAGNVRTHQVWYRNAAAFCNPETYNLSNGWSLLWLP